MISDEQYSELKQLMYEILRKLNTQESAIRFLATQKYNQMEEGKK